jgi:hypothetical protein
MKQFYFFLLGPLVFRTILHHNLSQIAKVFRIPTEGERRLLLLTTICIFFLYFRVLFVVFLRRPLKISIKEIPSIYRYHSSDPTHGSFLPICISFPRQGFGGCDRHTNPPQERETPKQKDQLTDISLFFSIQSHKEIIPKLLFLSRTLEGG